MRRLLTVSIAIICLSLNSVAQTNIIWRAGDTIAAKTVKTIAIDKLFSSQEIDNKIFNRIRNKSFKSNCTTPRQDLRYLKIAHININGKVQMGELICHKSIANDLIEIFKQLYLKKYPIERMVLIDEYGADDEASMSANNTSCFNFRKINGSTKLSKHCLGMAVDINPRYNPCVHSKTGLVEPANAKDYAHNRDKHKSEPVKLIDRQDLCYKLFMAHGFRWGGDWKSVKDYQHFEK